MALQLVRPVVRRQKQVAAMVSIPPAGQLVAPTAVIVALTLVNHARPSLAQKVIQAIQMSANAVIPAQSAQVRRQTVFIVVITRVMIARAMRQQAVRGRKAKKGQAR